MRKDLWVFAVAGTLLLAGAGCGPDTTVTPINSKPADTNTAVTTTANTNVTSTPAVVPPVQNEATSIDLTAKALGNKMVQFSWKLPDGAKNPSGFHILRSQNPNPTQPPSHWFYQVGSSRTAIWVKLPLGEEHFRICTWENGKCALYSNDIVVDVR